MQSIAESFGMKKLSDDHLRRRVLAPNAGHHAASSRLVDDVSHHAWNLKPPAFIPTGSTAQAVA